MKKINIKDFQKKYNCIFIHVPKAAGTSIEKAIYETDKWLTGHAKAKDYNQVEFQKFFSFGFVRNPYDRIVSAFHYLKNGGGSDIDAQWAKENLSCYKNFHDFVLDLKNKQIQEKILSWMHFEPQYRFLCDNEKNIMVNFVGKVENIQEDFNYIITMLQINRKLSHANKNTHLHYTNYYTHETYKIIRELYKDDFELFDYDIEDNKILHINDKDFIDYLKNKVLLKNEVILKYRNTYSPQRPYYKSIFSNVKDLFISFKKYLK
ncbi:sulfotransferase family protein [Campylobacter sp. IFREMER_LSEM_CL2101]|uniref:sulfotransferase family protein n=1 Tax=Campylobacter sp. IFREMER_LSEM_CL2101 TaxID=2911618 RepID=UPI0021E7684E|nr:sulfotransferase family protein [Campylobacter sp. IFREMER_LSEM_CL2101]MCV3392122.1 sulfotransferase family protein [Campylobacter sp. IFREMER_LSEM_CL2101]